MNAVSFLKSKAFKEREENAREKLRQAVKRDLIADLSRLFGDASFSDVTFMINNVEFQAHTVVLRARAPNFCQHFLPRYASAGSVQTCIQINGIEAIEFEKFLRSAYTEDDFKDYDGSSFPWEKETIPSLVDGIDHVVDGTCKEDSFNKRFENDIDHLQNNIQPEVWAGKDGIEGLQAKPEEFDGNDATCTQSYCDMDGNGSGTVGDGTVEGTCKGEETSGTRDNDCHSDSKLPQASCMEDTLSFEERLDSRPEFCDHFAVSLGNIQETYLSDVNQQQHDLEENQHSSNLVDGPGNVIDEENVESDCNADGIGSDSHTTRSSCLLNKQVAEIKTTNELTDELTSTDGRILENSFKTKLDIGPPGDDSLGDELKSCCCTLGQELLQLLISEVGSDVVFIVNGDKIKAHKAILCARSNYFSAMLYGDWIEGKTKEIPLIGVNYNGFMAVLKYIYGGTAHVKGDFALICDALPLVDMYGLEGLREIINCTLKIDKCHMFHKPCAECLAGIPECLEVSELFSLTDLKKSCIKWMAKHFDRTLGTKGFASLPKLLQEEILAEIQRSFVVASAIEVLNHCDKLSSCTPLVKWTEPVHLAVSAVQESCLLFITQNFFRLIDQRSFHEILKGVGWSVPVLEKILSAIKKNLTIENCCDLLRALLKLQRILKVKAQENDEECYSEEVTDLVVNLHKDCVKVIRCNLFKVTRSEGWKKLKLSTQREVKEGALFSGLSDSGENSSGKRRSVPSSLQASARPSTMRSFQRAETESRTTGRGRGNSASDRSSQQSRPTSGRSSRNSIGLAPTNMRPSSGRPSTDGRGVRSVRGKISSATSSDSGKRPSSSQASMPSRSSRASSSLSRSSDRNSLPNSRSYQNSSASGHRETSKTSSQSSHQHTVTSSNGTRSLWTQSSSNARPSSAPSSSGAIRKVPLVSRPPVPKGTNRDINNTSSKRIVRDKLFSVQGCGAQAKKGPSVSNSRVCRQQQVSENVKATTNSFKANKPSKAKGTSSQENLKQDLKNGPEASNEPGLREHVHSKDDDVGRTRKMEEVSDNIKKNDISLEELKDGVQSITSEEQKQSNTSSTLTRGEEGSLPLNETADENVSRSLDDDSVENAEVNDSLELD